MLRSYLYRIGFSHQLTIALGIVALGLGSFAWLTRSWDESQRLERYLIEQGLRITENLARHSARALLSNYIEDGNDGADITLAFPDVLQVEINDASHRVLLLRGKPDKHLSTERAHPPHPGTNAILEQETPDYWRFEAPVYVSKASLPSFNQEEQSLRLLGYAHVVLSKATLKDMTASLIRRGFLITLSVFAVALLVVGFLTRRMLRPLKALSRLMGRAEAGESGMRASTEGSRDFADMAHAFNKMMDVLEWREAELKHSRDEALRSALMKSQFAATVSHELRTPLNGLVGMLDILREMRLTKRQQDCVDVAWDSSRTLIALINDILDFSKMEAGKLELEETDTDLRALAEEAIELFARQAQQKGLEIGYLFDSGAPDWIKGDPLRLRQILFNMISNAVKFTDRGEVALRIFQVRHDDTPLLRFEVCDTGIGMDATTVSSLFQSFSQANRSTSRQYGGTGLGLAICKQLVQLMGGSIGIVSEPGRGTTVWFAIPCKQGRTLPVVARDPVLAGRRVLIVEQSDIVRRFLEDSVARHGMHCKAVPDGADALAELARAGHASDRYELIIMDVRASDEQGGNLARRIRSERHLPPLRFLLLERYAAPTDGGLRGNDFYLGKPLRLDRLLNAIRSLFPDDELRLPGPQAGSQEHAAVPMMMRQCRVLVAEDNRTNRLVAAGMLEMCGCHSEFAVNGEEAAKAVRRSRFDLILMDCSMPEMDGYEATAHIRHIEKPLGRRTPIIAMTANTQPADIEKCLAAGMDDYLAKPIALAELRAKLECWHAFGSAADNAKDSPRAVRPEAEECVLDHVVFNKLREVLGSALPQAVTPFLEDTLSSLDRLEHAVAENDAGAARMMAHAIKGSGSNLGAAALAQLAREVEELAAEHHIADIAPLLPRLRQAYAAVAALLANEGWSEKRHGAAPDETLAQVLVVDDDRSTRSALRHALQRDGLRVEEAADGAQALAMLKRQLPDVILMDAMMPAIDGFTACARIQELPEGQSIPVVLMTALEDNASVERAFAAGACDYVLKPIQFAALAQRIRRIIEASRAEKHIRHLAYNDSVTGLPNRTALTEALDRRIGQARPCSEPVAVLILDLDRFKNVNDSPDDDAGDHLLAAVAQRLRRSVRNADCVARLGDDEFAVVLADVAGPNASVAAKNIRRALTAPFRIDGNDISITASIGIAMYPRDGTDALTLLKHADTAMCRAKIANSGFEFFEASMEQLICAHQLLENELRRALQREEFVLFYQPQARLGDGRVIGAEALVRWNHPVRGMIAPDGFIPLAEENALINPLGEWVLRTACAQARAWIEAGLPAMRIAVNLCAGQLLQPDFDATVKRILADCDLPASLLELEITENTLMEHTEDTLSMLQRLHDLGIRLAIDDFGTGYSSLAYLKRFPVHVIKIDRSFIKNALADADDASIVTAIIALAHSLRLEVVAEGVETGEHLQFLREHACDTMQGYYLREPVPADEFAEHLAARHNIPAV